MNLIPLRHYQADAIDQVRARIGAGVRRLVLVLATGGGKTIVASHIISSAIAKGTRCLFLARRREIIKQTFCKLVRNGIAPSDIGITMAGVSAGPADVRVDLSLSDNELWSRYARRRPSAPVTVASLDTIRSRAKPQVTLIIVDECHGSNAKGFVSLLGSYGESVVVCGLTATPYRGDNRGLGEEVPVCDHEGNPILDAKGRKVTRPLYQDLVSIVSPRQLVAEGFLVEPRVWTVPAEEMPDIARVKIVRGDYDPAELNAAVDRDSLVGNVVEHYAKRSLGVRAVAFPCSVAHSHHVVDRFNGAGIRAEHLDGNTKTADRDAILARLERGETMVVSSVGVLVEGWDQPSAKTAMLLTPTRSTGRYLQMAGRILRPWNGQGAVILDHAGLTLAHGFVTDDREFTLEARDRKSKISAAPAKTCPSCFAVIPSALTTCPGCDFEFPASAPRAMPEEAEGNLVEVVAPSHEDLRAAWEAIVVECVKGSYKPGWTLAKWGEKFPGQRPPDGCAPPTPEECAAKVNARALVLDEYLKASIDKSYRVGWAKSSFKARDGSWPSIDLLNKTDFSEQLRAVLAGFEALGQAAARWSQRPTIAQPVAQTVTVIAPPTSIPVAQALAVVTVSEPAVQLAAANDLVSYDLGA